MLNQVIFSTCKIQFENKTKTQQQQKTVHVFNKWLVVKGALPVPLRVQCKLVGITFFLFFAPHLMFSLEGKLTDDKSSMGMKSSEALKEIQDCMFNLLFVVQ